MFEPNYVYLLDYCVFIRIEQYAESVPGLHAQPRKCLPPTKSALDELISLAFHLELLRQQECLLPREN